MPDPANKSAFESELAKADGIAAKLLAESPDDRNALFARSLADGLRGNYAALVEDRKRDALGYLKSSRITAEKLIDIDPTYNDAYLAVGIENYLLGARSAPSRWMLRLAGAETDKEKGLGEPQNHRRKRLLPRSVCPCPAGYRVSSRQGQEHSEEASDGSCP